VDARNIWSGTIGIPTIDAGIFDSFDSCNGIVFIDLIALSPPPDGDYNDDGMVEATDYVACRKNDGTQHGDVTWRAWLALRNRQ
jgi:hypothetical protein